MTCIENDMQTLQTIIASIISMVGALGGWEAVKYMINRKYNKRKEEAEADSVEFNVLRETVDFLQTQLQEKEKRFAEQTDVMRKLNTDVLELTKAKAQLELDLQRYRCVVKNCVKREPQNGY